MSGVMTLKRYPSQGGMTFGKIGARRMTWKNPYITDGLVAWWDGIWNTGIGVHDSNATVWKELISEENNFTNIGSGKWNDNSVMVTPSILSKYRFPAGVETIELVMDIGAYAATTNFNYITLPVNNPTAEGTNKNTWMLKLSTGTLNGQNCFFVGTRQKLPVIGDTFPKHISISFGLDGILTDIYFDGVTATLGGYEYQYSTSSNIRLSSPNSGGKVYALRGYTRTLTYQERQHNLLSDRIRFNLP